MGSSEPSSLFCLVCVVELLLVLSEVDHTLDKANEEGGEWRHEEEGEAEDEERREEEDEKSVYWIC